MRQDDGDDLRGVARGGAHLVRLPQGNNERARDNVLFRNDIDNNHVGIR